VIPHSESRNPHSLGVFVTGATGFVGRRLVETLLESGHTVVAHGRRAPASPHSPIPVSPDSAFAIPHSAFSQVTGDLVKGEGLERIEECDAVVHLAAAGVKAAGRQWDVCTGVNIVGTQALLSALGRCANVPALFFPRTFYQDHLTEVPILWENPYVATKEAATRLVERWQAQDCPQARVIFGTVFQAYGPGDDPNNLVNYAIRQLGSGQPALFGSGTALRDWIHIEDLARGVMAALEQDRTERTAGVRRYDLGTGVGHSIRQVVEEIARALGVDANASFDPAGDRNDAAVSAVAKEPVPRWTPRYSIAAGIEGTIRSLRSGRLQGTGYPSG
jgi:nucleoside-diphosphate-sugar epimerase